MISDHTIFHKLIDLDEKITSCPNHSSLVGDIRNERREIDILLDQTNELKYSLICDRLKALTLMLPGECSFCSESMWEICVMEEGIRREIETPQSPDISDAELPPNHILQKVIRDTYPFPIAASYRQVCESEYDPLRAIDKIISAFDTTYRYYCYIILLSISFIPNSSDYAKVLSNIWKNMARPDINDKSLGRIIDESFKDFYPNDNAINELIKHIIACKDYIKIIVNLRNEVKHETGSYFDDFPTEKIIEDMKKGKAALEKFLWKTQYIRNLPLIYLRKPLGFNERINKIEFEIYFCMGSDQHYEKKSYYLPLNAMLENLKVCLCLELDEKEKYIGTLMPLYPLVATFPMKPRPQIYMYHDFDSIKNIYNYFHPINEKIIVTNKNYFELFNELENRIKYGIISGE